MPEEEAPGRYIGQPPEKVDVTAGPVGIDKEPALSPEENAFWQKCSSRLTQLPRNPKTLARPWAIPGTPGLEHRIGGLEKEDVTGNVSYDPMNHQKMIHLRAAKVAGIAEDISPIEVFGKAQGDVLVVGWGGTYGAITSAVEYMQKQGLSVSSIHIRFLNPFPKNLGTVLKSFKKVLIPELNSGQLALLIRSQFLVDAKSLCKVQGKPFKIQEIVEGIQSLLSSRSEVKNVAASE